MRRVRSDCRNGVEASVSGTQAEEETQHVEVYCRIRPFLRNLTDNECMDKTYKGRSYKIISNEGDAFPRSIRLNGPKKRRSAATPSSAPAVHPEEDDCASFSYFTFDRVFPENATQEDVFELSVKRVIMRSLAGFNGTIMTYGQTGSGKTHTLTGGDSFKDRGVIPRTIETLFEAIDSVSETTDFRVQITYLQIYNNCAYDLLDPRNENAPIEAWRKIKMLTHDRERSTAQRMVDLGVHEVKSQMDALGHLFRGNANRIISETPMNLVSSRSHCIFTLHVESKQRKPFVHRRSLLRLVDLAGSESVYRRVGSQQTTTESIRINLSLHHLERVITSLRRRQRQQAKQRRGGGTIKKFGHVIERGQMARAPTSFVHVPFRDCMLTSLLRDSLGGKCATVFIVTLNPEKDFFDETMSSCRFAARCGELKCTLRADVRTATTTSTSGDDKESQWKDALVRMRRENMELRRRVLLLDNALQASLATTSASSRGDNDDDNDDAEPKKTAGEAEPENEATIDGTYDYEALKKFICDPSTDAVPASVSNMSKLQLIDCIREIKGRMSQDREMSDEKKSGSWQESKASERAGIESARSEKDDKTPVKEAEDGALLWG